MYPEDTTASTTCERSASVRRCFGTNGEGGWKEARPDPSVRAGGDGTGGQWDGFM